MALHVLGSVEPVKASQAGALDGFGFRCSCNDGRIAGSSSLESLARELRSGHAAWARGRGDEVAAA
jgi:hypothetical protein